MKTEAKTKSPAKSDDRYSLSFTTGPALIVEMVLVASIWLEKRNWKAVKAEVLDNNRLQARTVSTLRKIYGEVSRRLEKLNEQELLLLVHGTDRDRQQVTWLAICRKYLLIHDFAIEVLADHYAKSRFSLGHDDYDAFFNAKAQWHSNLEEASPLTRGKARQVLFRMLKECGLVNEAFEIMPQRPGRELLAMLAARHNDFLRIFPGAEH